MMEDVRDTRTRGAARAPKTPAVVEAPPPLPRPAGPARAVAMLVDPRRIHLYWIRDATLDAILENAAGPAELRVEVSSGGAGWEETGRQEFDFGARGWYLTNDRLDCRLRVRLGLRQESGFRELLVSNAVRVPRQSAGAGTVVGRTLPAEGGAEGAGAAGETPAPWNGRHASSPGRGSGWSNGNLRPVGRAALDRPAAAPPAAGYLALVLHAHMPFVRHPEHDYFLEEQWLFETITETYLPLLDILDHLDEDGRPARVTFSLTATLMAMLRDPVLMAKYERHLARLCRLAESEVARTRRDARFAPVAGFYRDRLERLRWLFSERYHGDLVGRFAALEEQGILEIVACAATHGFLPHLALDEAAVRAQVAVGVAEHRRQIGRAPRGIWLPECAYYEGLDTILADAGIRYFFVDAHAVRNASSPPVRDVHAPIFTPAGPAVFARDEECSVQVWSAELGYPGDPAYREFYRDIGYDLDHEYIAPWLDPSGVRGMTGLKYHRVTGRTDRKEPYRRDWAVRTAAVHAADFVANRRAQAAALAGRLDRRPLIVAMYDAELFGHWWFEGPEWLEGVLRLLPPAGIRAVTPGDYLALHPEGQVAEPSASSWGERGYNEVWLNHTNDWLGPHLHDAARRMRALARRAPGDALAKRALAQAQRELLLAQASDWPFIMKNQTAVAYARRRVHEHLHRFDVLARQIEQGRLEERRIAAYEAIDNLFPDIDTGVWACA